MNAVGAKIIAVTLSLTMWGATGICNCPKGIDGGTPPAAVMGSGHQCCKHKQVGKDGGTRPGTPCEQCNRKNRSEQMTPERVGLPDGHMLFAVMLPVGMGAVAVERTVDVRGTMGVPTGPPLRDLVHLACQLTI